MERRDRPETASEPFAEEAACRCTTCSLDAWRTSALRFRALAGFDVQIGARRQYVRARDPVDRLVKQGHDVEAKCRGPLLGHPAPGLPPESREACGGSPHADGVRYPWHRVSAATLAAVRSGLSAFALNPKAGKAGGRHGPNPTVLHPDGRPLTVRNGALDGGAPLPWTLRGDTGRLHGAETRTASGAWEVARRQHPKGDFLHQSRRQLPRRKGARRVSVPTSSPFILGSYGELRRPCPSYGP